MVPLQVIEVCQALHGATYHVVLPANKTTEPSSAASAGATSSSHVQLSLLVGRYVTLDPVDQNQSKNVKVPTQQS